MPKQKKKKQDKRMIAAIFLVFIIVAGISTYKGGQLNTGSSTTTTTIGDEPDPFSSGGSTTTSTTHIDPTHSTATTTPITCINREGEVFPNYGIEWQQCDRYWQYRLCEWGKWTSWSTCSFPYPNDMSIIA